MTLREALVETALGLQKQLDDQVIELWPGFAPHTDPSHLEWMLEKVVEKAETWPTDKTSRWIGFVQGAMAANGWLDVNEERKRTRKLFHAAYMEEGLVIPETEDKD